MEEGGVRVLVGWPNGPCCLGSPHTTHPLSHLVAAVLGVHPSRAQQGVKVGDSVCKCAFMSVCMYDSEGEQIGVLVTKTFPRGGPAVETETLFIG